MQMIFLYGHVAAGKLTVARALAERTGFALFHNHLVVDAVAAVFPFGSPDFVALRERFWMDMLRAATAAGRPLIFTFAPEGSVAPDFPERFAAIVTDAGGQVLFVRLDIDAAEQERRLVSQDRGAFGKLRSLELLRHLRGEFEQGLAAMPPAAVVIDTETHSPEEAAAMIVAALPLPYCRDDREVPTR